MQEQVKKRFSVDDPISPRAAALCMGMCAFLWSTSGALVKMISWSGTVIACLRSAIAFVVLYAFLKLVGKRLVLNRLTLLAGCAVCIKYVSFIVGNKLTSSANMIALQYTSPIFVLIISALFFGQRARGKDVAVVLLVAGGVAMLTLDPNGYSTTAGNLLGLAVGVTTAIMYLFTRRCASYEESLSIIILGHLYTSVAMLPFLISDWGGMEMTGQNIGGILLLGLIQQGASYAFYSFAIRSAPALTCNIIGCINPLFNPIWTAVLVGEIPGPVALVGFAVVLVSITGWSISNSIEKNRAAAREAQ